VRLDEASRLANRLMLDHGLCMISPGGTRLWTFKWMQSNRVAGRCVPRVQQIRLSAPIVRINRREDVEILILHEIAHARAWIAGYGCCHNRTWQEEATRIGGPAAAKVHPPIKLPDARWTLRCPGCKAESKRFDRQLRVDRPLWCRACRVSGRGWIRLERVGKKERASA
jgi:predicted SprT family Zn-dependent metalloprotease